MKPLAFKIVFFFTSSIYRLSIYYFRNNMINRMNHRFGNNVIGSVDTFPIVVNRPKQNQSYLYNGKYKQHVYKVTTCKQSHVRIYIVVCACSFIFNMYRSFQYDFVFVRVYRCKVYAYTLLQYVIILVLT